MVFLDSTPFYLLTPPKKSKTKITKFIQVAMAGASSGVVRQMGQANSTTGGYLAAIKLFDKFQVHREDPAFDNLTEEDVENDNLSYLYCSFLTWAANTPIHDASSKNPEKMITFETKEKYIGKVKEAFKKKFMGHEWWKSEETWGPDLKKQFKKEASRHQLEGHDQGFKDPKTTGLYKRIEGNPGLQRAKYRVATTDGESVDFDDVRDMEGVSKALIGKAQKGVGSDSKNYQRRAWLNTCMVSVGRGGEPKFLRFDEMTWDAYFQCPDATWTDMKNLRQSCMLYGPDRDDYPCDIYHSWGCHWFVEDGLHRSNTQASTSKFVFPDLHKYKNASVAKTLTVLLKSHVAKDIATTTSIKSVRISSTTVMAAHPLLSFMEFLARGGWSSGTRGDTYVELIPALSLPGMLVIGSWQDPHARVYPPNLECLGADVQDVIERFIQEGFTVDVLQFLPGGNLRPLLRTCTASLMMYFPKILLDFGPRNAVVEKLIAVGRKVGIGHDVSAVLHEYAETIRNDFRARNVEIRPATTEVNLIDTINQQSRVLCEVRRRQADESTAKQVLAREVTSLRTDVSGLRTDVSNLLAALSAGRQDSQPPSSKRARLDGMAQAQPAEEGNVAAVAAASLLRDLTLTQVLAHGSRADATAESDAGVPMRSIIQQLYNDGQLRNKETIIFKNTKLNHLGEHDKYLSAMTLVQKIWEGEGLSEEEKFSNEQKRILLNEDSSHSEVKTAAAKIENLVMDQMFRLENELLPEESRKKKKSKHKSYFIGLGIRYKKYETACERKAEEAAAGNAAQKRSTSIMNFFQTK